MREIDIVREQASVLRDHPGWIAIKGELELRIKLAKDSLETADPFDPAKIASSQAEIKALRGVLGLVK